VSFQNYENKSKRNSKKPAKVSGRFIPGAFTQLRIGLSNLLVIFIEFISLYHRETCEIYNQSKQYYIILPNSEMDSPFLLICICGSRSLLLIYVFNVGR